MTISKPAPTEYAPYYDSYIKKVSQSNLMDALRVNEEQLDAFFKTIPADKGDYRYADGKWTIKEVLLHINDTERIFSYRALTFARNDKTELPGFDEQEYAPNSGAASRSLSSIHDEFLAIRRASTILFKSFSEEMISRVGVANRNRISVRAIGFILAGHAQHHMEIIKERYL